MFDNMVVVTSLSDVDTLRICNKYNVRCIQTDVFYENNEVFNKGAGINVGLQALNRTGWVLHLDADIYLPPLTRHVMRKFPFDETKIYSVDRLMCPDYEAWMRYRESWRSVNEDWAFTHLDLFKAGSRIVQYGDYLEEGEPDGWVPIGYFQLWHPNGSTVHSYPAYHGAADRSDVLHAKQWPRPDRVLIPEAAVIHLESENCSMGANWRGRKTRRFGFPTLQLDSLSVPTKKPALSSSYYWQGLREFLKRVLGRPTY